MRMIALVLFSLLFNTTMKSPTIIQRVPTAKVPSLARSSSDWLLHPPKASAKITKSRDGRELVIENGLIRRVLRISPDAATVSFDNLTSGESLLRSVRPEAVVEIDGTHYSIGGLTGQPDLAYLKAEWLDKMQADPAAFHFTTMELSKPAARLSWKRARHSADLPWPPPGAAVTLHFAPPENKLDGIVVDVHYEIFDGIPLISKWLTVHNKSSKTIRLNSFIAETLGVVERESIVDDSDRWEYPNLTVVTDYSFGGMSVVNSTKTVNWLEDRAYSTQVNYNLKTPCLLEVKPPLGPDTDIAPGASLDTFRVFELAHDTTERERKGLSVRRMYRELAPWATENPLMMHLTTTNPEKVKIAIDQCAEVGFEMVIFSFGSGLNMEDDSPKNIARFREFVDYAHKKGIQIGGYSLLASRSISEADDVINPKTGKTGGAIFGSSPCLGSKWGIAYFEHIKNFLEKTGFDLLEHDGSYPGDRCASTKHPGHHGLEDSQWAQYQQIAELYRWCKSRGIFLNVPDWYFLVGTNKTGMGYRETNWSLPRAQQHIHARQNLYDGTWEKAPTMGWMFTPLVEYQGGGAAATIEPLHEHLDDYSRHLANCLGYGAQSCYRGPRLYDTEETKIMVKGWVDFFKKHRAILESDVIHIRRADGRDLDAILHVNPNLPEKGLAMIYNPTDAAITRELTIPLYYTGLTDRASVSVGEGRAKTVILDRQFNIRIKVTVPAGRSNWLVIR